MRNTEKHQLAHRRNAVVKNSKDDQKLGPKFAQAFLYAFVQHAEQTRKGPDNIPYIAHLMSVAALVLEEGGGEDEAIAALLHDTIEDQGGPPRREEIKEQFGKRIAEIVDGCTDSDKITKPPWKERKENYIKHLYTASPEVLRVSLADKLHNARSTLKDLRRNGDKVWDRFNQEASKEDQLENYRALVNAFRDAGGLVEMVDELDRTVKEIEKESRNND